MKCYILMVVGPSELYGDRVWLNKEEANKELIRLIREAKRNRLRYLKDHLVVREMELDTTGFIGFVSDRKGRTSRTSDGESSGGSSSREGQIKESKEENYQGPPATRI